MPTSTTARSIRTTPVDALRVKAVLCKLRVGAALSSDDLALVADIVESWAHLSERAQRFDLSLSDLRRMLGVLGRPAGGGASETDGATNTEGSGDPGAASGLPAEPAAEAAHDGAVEDETVQPETQASGASPEESSVARDAHGRRGGNDFADLPCEHHPHDGLASGCTCPTCQHGRLYRFFPRTFVTISGQGPFVGRRHEIERLQCNVCGDIFEAKLPEHLVADGVGTGKLYTYSAHSAVVMLKYLGVMPWHRQQTLQSAMGLMVPDACMWDMCESLCAIARPVVTVLQRLAGESPLLYGDDTTAVVLGLTSEMKVERTTGKQVERTGCHTTAVIARQNDRRYVAVFQVGIQHSGELLDALLVNRPTDLPPPLIMGDAAASNTVTVCAVHMCGCNAHALRRFKDLERKHPDELTALLAAYRTVYAHDAHTLSEAMSDEKRLAYHREHSRPIFKKMCRDAQAMLNEHKVEPNSALGSALDYLLNHERRLSAFFRLPGAPIDNNLVERELRLPVRLRDAAPIFRSQVGASVAADLWTLLVTTLLNGVNAFDYLNVLQRYQADVRAEPSAWLPWNYRQRLEELAHTQSPSPQRVKRTHSEWMPPVA